MADALQVPDAGSAFELHHVQLMHLIPHFMTISQPPMWHLYGERCELVSRLADWYDHDNMNGRLVAMASPALGSAHDPMRGALRIHFVPVLCVTEPSPVRRGSVLPSGSLMIQRDWCACTIES